MNAFLGDALTIVFSALLFAFWLLFIWHVNRVDKELAKSAEAQVEVSRRVVEDVVRLRSEVRDDMNDIRRQLFNLISLLSQQQTQRQDTLP